MGQIQVRRQGDIPPYVPGMNGLLVMDGQEMIFIFEPARNRIAGTIA